MDEDHGGHGVEKLRYQTTWGSCPTNENMYIMYLYITCYNVDESAHPTESKNEEVASV